MRMACVIKIPPKNAICVATDKSLSGSINCGKKAIKNNDTFGFRTFIKKPTFHRFQKDGEACSLSFKLIGLEVLLAAWKAK